MTDSSAVENETIEALLAEEQQSQGWLFATRIQIGLELERMRKERNLSFREAAQLIDYDTSNLSKLEKGKIWNREVVERAVQAYTGIIVNA
jgi:hypothetical protein